MSESKGYKLARYHLINLKMFIEENKNSQIKQSKAVLTKYLRLEIYSFFSPNEALIKVAKLSHKERDTLLCLANVYKESKFIIHFPPTPKFSTRINYIFNFASKYEISCFDGLRENIMKPDQRTEE